MSALPVRQRPVRPSPRAGLRDGHDRYRVGGRARGHPFPAVDGGTRGRPEDYGHRQMLDALRYLADNGVKWRSLPEPFPPPRGTLRAADGRDH
ncbi:transposase [Streptomyces zaomyceticus]